jgi:hypothetical protein
MSRKTPANFDDLTGQRFCRLLVISRAVGYGARWRVYWNCVCDCGGVSVVTSDNLKRGNSKSCGCYRAQRRVESHTSHGMRRTSEYSIWCNMVRRCTDPNAIGYKRYGGRGIVVCSEWLKFENFYRDMGDRPTGKTLERVSNDKGYNDTNCVWATRSEQALNRHNKKLITIFGETKNEKMWAMDDRCAVSYHTFRRRIQLGWVSEVALTKPTANGGKTTKDNIEVVAPRKNLSFARKSNHKPKR